MPHEPGFTYAQSVLLKWYTKTPKWVLANALAEALRGRDPNMDALLIRITEATYEAKKAGDTCHARWVKDGRPKYGKGQTQ